MTVYSLKISLGCRGKNINSEIPKTLHYWHTGGQGAWHKTEFKYIGAYFVQLILYPDSELNGSEVETKCEFEEPALPRYRRISSACNEIWWSVWQNVMGCTDGCCLTFWTSGSRGRANINGKGAALANPPRYGKLSRANIACAGWRICIWDFDHINSVLVSDILPCKASECMTCRCASRWRRVQLNYHTKSTLRICMCVKCAETILDNTIESRA